MKCIKCGETRETEFYPSCIKRGDYRCKSCCCTYMKQWRMNNIDKIRKWTREWMRNHPEANKRNQKKWFEQNKELQYQRRKVYAQVDPQRHRAQCYAQRKLSERQICEIEGCFELGERHHENYNKPYEIKWLCRKHHKELSRLEKLMV